MLEEKEDNAHKVTSVFDKVHFFLLWVKLFPLVSHWKSGCNPRIEWPFLCDSLVVKMDSEVKCRLTNNCTVNSALSQASETRYETELKP